MKKRFLFLLQTIALAATSYAQAEVTTPVYAGLDLGSHHINNGKFDDKEGIAGSFKLGWQLNDQIAIELGHDALSSSELNVSIFPIYTTSLDIDFTTLSMSYRYPLTKRFALLGEAGGYYWESTVKIKGSEWVSLDNSGPQLQIVTRDVEYKERDYGSDFFCGLGLQFQHRYAHLVSQLTARYYHWKPTLLDDAKTDSIVTVTYGIYWRF